MVTLKEIARDVGVSVVTVSKVLRNHLDISHTTRDRVLRRARELGYRPNLTARSLVTGRSSLVGLLVPDLVHPFFAEVARSLAGALRVRGLYLLICSSEGDPELEREQIEHLLSRRIDAIVVAPVGQDDDALESISSSGTPLILLDRQSAIAGAHFVGVNDFQIGLIATDHLISIGCRRIAHLRGPQNSVGLKRLEGYRKALKVAGLPFDPDLVSETSKGDVVSKAQGAKETARFLRLDSPPDGIFCFSDPMAIGAMDVALQAGVSIPKQLAVIGSGNLHYDTSLRVPLSSVDQKSEKIGQRVAEIILRLVLQDKTGAASKTPIDIERVVLRPALVPRDSTAR
jgi:LacI family transcriptional regulator